MSTAAGGTISANFEARDQHMESAIGFDLLLEFVELIADEFGDFSATQARHVYVIFPQLALVIMALAVEVHEIEFVDQSVTFEQAESAIHGAAIDTGVEALRLPQNLACVQMLVGGFDDAQNRAALLSHPNAALGEMRLQMSRYFGLRKRHSSLIAFLRRNWSQPECDGIFARNIDRNNDYPACW